MIRRSVRHLRDDQLRLLHSVLRAGEVAITVVDGEVHAQLSDVAEVERAIRWAGAVHGPAPDEPHDPDLAPSGRAPLVPPSRPPFADGRRLATRWRRLAAGIIDELLAGVPIWLALAAGASPLTALAIHAGYHIVPTTVCGWTLGKLWCGLRTVSVRTLRRPDPLAALTRWLVVAIPLAVGVVEQLPGDAVALASLAVYAPVLWNLRGVHDRASGTAVVERSPAGPGLWVRSRHH